MRPLSKLLLPCLALLACGPQELVVGEADEGGAVGVDEAALLAQHISGRSGYARDERTGHGYVFVRTPRTFDEASSHCTALRGQLATIDDAEESAFLTPHLRVRSWLGLTDRQQEGTFRTPDGANAGFTFWSAGEPNNSGDEDCVEAFADGSGPVAGSWNDAACTEKRAYVCEFPSGLFILPLHPGEVTEVQGGWGGGGGYLQVESGVPFAAAEQACAGIDGALAVAPRDGEADAIAQQLTSPTYWVGLTDRTQEGRFSWLDGSQPEAWRWLPGEPNDAGGNEDCAELAGPSSVFRPGRFNDVPCDAPRPFLCELKHVYAREFRPGSAFIYSRTAYEYPPSPFAERWSKGVRIEIRFRERILPGEAEANIQVFYPSTNQLLWSHSAQVLEDLSIRMPGAGVTHRWSNSGDVSFEGDGENLYLRFSIPWGSGRRQMYVSGANPVRRE